VISARRLNKAALDHVIYVLVGFKNVTSIVSAVLLGQDRLKHHHGWLQSKGPQSFL
jgi:uncharacterized membrane protein YuzA (DUF378 family)